MDFILWAIIGILTAVVIVLAIRLHLIKKAAAEIAAAFADRLAEETNTLIDISCRDRQMRDLATEINRQLVKLREERRRFQQGDSELKEAVTNISHDLRTPLTAICGYLELLEREDTSATTARYIGLIANRTEALKALTEELFRYSVLASTDDESREPLSLNDVLEESLLSFYGALEQRRIRPNIDITATRVERTLNRSALSRIFGNIITNALKYSDGDLSVTMDEQGRITFSNAAAAISSVEAGKLFDRFFTVESGRGSTGLGLSIAKLLTERMGGAIAADYHTGRLYITVQFANEPI